MSIQKLISEQNDCLEKLVGLTYKINAFHKQPKQDKAAVPKINEKRMTFDEFIETGINFGLKHSGVVPGAFFPKKKLPLIDGKAVGLVELAKHLEVKIIKSQDPKQTHVSLDFSLFTIEADANEAEVSDSAEGVAVEISDAICAGAGDGESDIETEIED
jgi:hypothetical protein